MSENALKELDLSIILPTYNEEGNIVALIRALHEVLTDVSYEIVVVDDHSCDETYDAVCELHDPRVKVIARKGGRSLGASVRCGIERSCGQVIAVMDSDFNHQPKYLRTMVESLPSYDGVFASRYLPGGGMNGRLRHVLSLWFNGYVRLMTGGKFTDSLYGYFMIKRDVMEQVNYNDVFWGYGDYCIRLLYDLQKNNANLLEIPAKNGRRLAGMGNPRLIKTFFQYAWAVIQLRTQRDRSQ